MPSPSELEITELENLSAVEKELTDIEKKLKPKRSNIVWPKSTANGRPRTHEEIFEIIQKIENGQQMSHDEAKGVAGRSLFFDLPNFDYVKDITVDYLHLVCLGVVKKCVELTFSVGENRQRNTRRPLSSPSLFNRLISNIKVVREFNRRVRDLDFAVYKGQEFRNLLLFFFPIILNCIEENCKERNMWLYLSFMVKLCVLPSEEFPLEGNSEIDKCTNHFYALYEELFGVSNCSYSTHVIGSHLKDMLCDGPLTKTSAFPFESFYGEMRQCFVPGTVSTLKQILSNVLIKRAISNHVCEKTIYISPKDTPMECNSMIYCFENGDRTMYKVKEKHDETITCYVQETQQCSFIETPDLNWNLVGVYRKGNIIEQNEIVIPVSSVKGKVLEVHGYLISCPNNVLREK